MYAALYHAFIVNLLAISIEIEIFGGASAKESCIMQTPNYLTRLRYHGLLYTFFSILQPLPFYHKTLVVHKRIWYYRLIS